MTGAQVHAHLPSMPTPFNPPRRCLTLWSHRDFVCLWSAHGVSNLGSRITREALPLTAILVLAAPTEQIGVLAALILAPGLLVGFIAGHWIDRLRKRPLMIAMDWLRALVLLSIPIAALFNALHIAHLYAVALCMGSLSALFEIADQSYLPTLLARKRLTEANAKLAATTAVTEASGPALTGALVQWLSAPIAMVFDALSFALSACFLARIRRREIVPAHHATVPLWFGVRAGVVASFSDPAVRAIFIANAMIALFAPMFVPIYAYYAIRELGMTPFLLGIAISCGGAGAMIGAALAPRLTRALGVARVLVLGLSMLGTAQLLVPIAHGSPVAATLWLGAAQFIGDGFFVLYLVNELSVRQQLIPAHLLGRANASLRMTTGALAPLGILLSGAAATLVGVRTMLWVSVYGLLCASLFLGLLLAARERTLHRAYK